MQETKDSKIGYVKFSIALFDLRIPTNDSSKSKQHQALYDITASRENKINSV